MVILDTPIWSLMLRRREPDLRLVREIDELIDGEGVGLLGLVRLELLSGFRERGSFVRLRDALHRWPNIPQQTRDYELAADFLNRCRSMGLQGSTTDFLICATAVRRDASIYTTDRDFARYATLLPIRLHSAEGRR